jgi:hypothetical protein
VFDDFCHANGTGDEHDTGSFEAEGHTIWYKIDHYERLPESPTTQPADQLDRVRVISVRLAEEN